MTEKRPYAAAANVMAVLQRCRTRNLPDKIDVEFMRIAGITEMVAYRVTFALRFLGLTEEEGKPTDKLRALASAPDAEFKELLGSTIREAYAEDFKKVNPAEDNQTVIIDAFRRYEPRSQTSRMVMFFLGMCREADIPVKDAPRDRKMQADPGRQRAARGGKVSAMKSSSTSTHIPTPPSSDGGTGNGRMLFAGVTESDLAALDEADFQEVWAALGKVVSKVARARARSNQASPIVPSVGAESEEEEEVDE